MTKQYEHYGKFPSIPNVYKRSEKTNKILEGIWSEDAFRYLQNNLWQFSEKIDGTNIRVIFDHGILSFRGRTDKAQVHKEMIEKLDQLFTPFRDKFESACFYGEGYGAGIQKGGKYRKDKGFMLFDIKIGSWYLRYYDVKKIADEMNIRHASLIYAGGLVNGIQLVQQGLRSQYGDFFAEGLVGIPVCQLQHRNGTRIITKIKHKDFYGVEEGS